MRVTYCRSDFIRLSNVKKEIAERYCDDNPKEQYGDDDFTAVYYLNPSPENHGVVGSGRWSETDTDRDRLIDDYNRSLYGE